MTESDLPVTNFGDWLRRSRESKGWSQLKLAEESGVSQPQISNLEGGRSFNPQAATKEKLEKALSLSVPPSISDEAREEETIAGLGVLTDFDPYDESALPGCHGVYVFYDLTDRPVYVGRATKRSIGERVREHFEKFWFKRPIVDRASYIEIGEEELCNQVEQVLIKFLKSHALLNKQHVDRS